MLIFLYKFISKFLHNQLPCAATSTHCDFHLPQLSHMATQEHSNSCTRQLLQAQSPTQCNSHTLELPNTATPKHCSSQPLKHPNIRLYTLQLNTASLTCWNSHILQPIFSTHQSLHALQRQPICNSCTMYLPHTATPTHSNLHTPQPPKT